MYATFKCFFRCFYFFIIFFFQKKKLESGADVQFNARLDRLIERARSISMPKQSVENAIRTGAGVRLTYDLL